MSFSIPTAEACGIRVEVTPDHLMVELSDGRTITAPLSWFPRLHEARAEERNHWEFTGRGEGIHWPEIDEDIRVADLLEGRRSQEAQASLERWRRGRRS